jgi:hypothetical protein
MLDDLTPLSIFNPGVVQIAGENAAYKNPLDWLEQTAANKEMRLTEEQLG